MAYTEREAKALSIISAVAQLALKHFREGKPRDGDHAKGAKILIQIPHWELPDPRKGDAEWLREVYRGAYAFLSVHCEDENDGSKPGV